MKLLNLLTLLKMTSQPPGPSEVTYDHSNLLIQQPRWAIRKLANDATATIFSHKWRRAAKTGREKYCVALLFRRCLSFCFAEENKAK